MSREYSNAGPDPNGEWIVGDTCKKNLPLGRGFQIEVNCGLSRVSPARGCKRTNRSGCVAGRKPWMECVSFRKQQGIEENSVLL